MRRSIRLDKEELEALAGVEFTVYDLVHLVDLCTIYTERFRDPVPVPEFMKPKPTAHNAARAADLEARRAFVEAVEGIWRERYRKRDYGSSYSWKYDRYDGLLLRLLRKLFEAMREPNPPSSATLHHDLDFLRTGRGERTRDSKRKRPRKRTRKQP
jgi:hypothetical protein